jgi:hypothetical protein
MTTATWAILGSLCINLMLGLVITAVFSVSPPVNAAELLRCPAQAAVQAADAAAHAAQAAAHAADAAAHAAAHAPQPPRSGHRYIVAVRMGWA